MTTVEIQPAVPAVLPENQLHLTILSSDRSGSQIGTPSRTPEPTCCTTSSSGSSSSSCSCSLSPATPSVHEQSWNSKPKSTQSRRKKASRACGHCQKAHLTCDDGRPCLRCEKRGLSATCRDGARKKAKYLSDYDDSLLVRRRPATGAPLGWTAETVLNSAEASWKAESDNRTSSSLPGWTADLWNTNPVPGGNPTAHSISWGDDPFFGHVVSESLPDGLVNVGLGLEDWLKGSDTSGVQKAEIPTSVKGWADRMTRELEIRKLAMHIDLEDEQMIRRSTERSLIQIERLISLSGTPTMVWSPSGEILKVGDEFCMLTEWSRNQLVGKQVAEVFDSQSFAKYLGLLEKNAFDTHTHQFSLKSCGIKKALEHQSLGCSFCFTIRRDIFNHPSLIVGNFLPILTQ